MSLKDKTGQFLNDVLTDATEDVEVKTDNTIKVDKNVFYGIGFLLIGTLAGIYLVKKF